MAMRNKTGMMGGFIFGVSGFLLLFKVIFLNTIPPEDEIPPGMVVFTAILNGLGFAYAGSLIQNYFVKKGS